MIYKICLIIFTIILIFLFFHLRKYIKTETKYDILQINNKLHYSKYKNYFNESIPVLLNNHSPQDIPNIVCPLTIQYKSFENIKLDGFYKHNHDSLFIISKDEDIIVNLSLPNKQKSKSDKYSLFKLEKFKSNIVQIKLSKNYILFIPRFWIFNIEENKNCSIFTSNTIFSIIFKNFINI